MTRLLVISFISLLCQIFHYIRDVNMSFITLFILSSWYKQMQLTPLSLIFDKWSQPPWCQYRTLARDVKYMCIKRLHTSVIPTIWHRNVILHFIMILFYIKTLTIYSSMHADKTEVETHVSLADLASIDISTFLLFDGNQTDTNRRRTWYFNNSTMFMDSLFVTCRKLQL